jgi:pSer/pThr/pTyr-binding forkhead associated (FHA) protein
MDAGIIIIVLVVVGLAGVGGFMVWRRQQNPADTSTGINTLAEKRDVAAQHPGGNPLPGISQTELQNTDALAVLEMADGPEILVNGQSVGKRIEVRKKRITIGRNPRQVDYQIYSLDQPSSVSRLHCTIEFHDALRCFFITDEGSSSGTKVDGRPVTPYKQHSLKNGDMIELGLIEKQGALLRFSSVFNPPERLSVEAGTEVKDTIRQPIDMLNAARGATQPVHRDIFISYSRRDREKMHVIRDGLVAQGLSVWSDEALEPGSPSWRHDVQLAIEGAGCIVALLSPDAKESEWVNEELGYAKIRKLRIFTVVVRGDESNAIPLGLTGVQWIDMRSDYQAEIEDLVHHSAIEQLVTAINEHLGKGQDSP